MLSLVLSPRWGGQLWPTGIEESSEINWSKFAKWDHALNDNRKVSYCWIFYWQHFWLHFRMIGIRIKTDTGRQIGPLNLLFMKFNTVKDKARVTHLNCLNHIHQIYTNLNYFKYAPSPPFHSPPSKPYPPTSRLPGYQWRKVVLSVIWQSEGLLQLSTGWKLTVSLALTRSQSGSCTKMGDTVLGVSVLI